MWPEKVVSGGGARAYAHLGAIRALREAGVPFDFVGGASMGAIVAAGIALAVEKGVLPASPPVEPVTKIDVLGKSADAATQAAPAKNAKTAIFGRFWPKTSPSPNTRLR